MKVEQFFYSDNQWSVNEFPKLDSENTLVLIFAAPEYYDFLPPFQELRKAYPHSKILGCSSAGEIYGKKILDKALTVAVVKFDKTTVKSCFGLIEKTDDVVDAGRVIGQKLNAPNLKSIFILSDGVHINGSQLVAGINSTVDEKVIVTGGLAGDGDRFESTWTVIDEQPPTKDMIVAIGLYGDAIEVGYGCVGGWDIFGHERVITRSDGNILYEIDGKPALEIYKNYLGELEKDLPQSALLFPLKIRENHDSEHHLVRTILSVDPDTQSMTFAGDIPQGWRAQLMHANFDRLIEGARDASKLANGDGAFSDDVLSIAISCVGRRLVLGERTVEEIESCHDKIGGLPHQIGFYSYGEISPLGNNRVCELHNQTMTLTTLREK